MMLLRELAGFDYKEIAGISGYTVKSPLRRALFVLPQIIKNTPKQDVCFLRQSEQIKKEALTDENCIVQNSACSLPCRGGDFAIAFCHMS